MMQAEDFMDIVTSRYSCRSYSDRVVEHENLVRLMDAARLAPSACNRQPWRFVVVTGGEKHAALRDCYRKDGFRVAPVCIACVGIHGESWKRPADGKDHADIDVAIAVEHICLEAEALGLATCWVCSFDVETAAEIIGLREGEELVALLPVGYAAPGVTPPAKVRKPLDEIVEWVC